MRIVIAAIAIGSLAVASPAAAKKSEPFSAEDGRPVGRSSGPGVEQAVGGFAPRASVGGRVARLVAVVGIGDNQTTFVFVQF
jgi:hypothetical protein